MITINNDRYEPEYFPDGTFRLRCDIDSEQVNITWKFEDNEELLILYYLVNHLRRVLKVEAIHLDMPYIPNARMDRTKKQDEIFTLKYFVEYINHLHFDSVRVLDPHSYVSLGMLDRIVVVDIIPTIKKLADTLLNQEDIVFFPDEGACKRYSETMKHKHAFGIKKRDWRTGEIMGLDVIGDTLQEGFNALIVDDICSYGGTFYHSAQRLKELGANHIWLYVTHCENSVLEGELIKSGLIDRIYTTDSIYTKEHELIKVIDIIKGEN